MASFCGRVIHRGAISCFPKPVSGSMATSESFFGTFRFWVSDNKCAGLRVRPFFAPAVVFVVPTAGLRLRLAIIYSSRRDMAVTDGGSFFVRHHSRPKLGSIFLSPRQ